MDGPPTFTAAIARTSDEQPPQATVADNSEEDNYNPSMSKLRSYSSFEDQTVDRAAVVQPAEIGDDDGDQAVSVGAIAAIRAKEVEMRSDESAKDEFNGDFGDSDKPAPSMEFMVGDRGHSQPAGGDFSYSAPPSQGEIGRHDGSHNGGSGGGGDLPEGDYEQMSFNGRNFARVRGAMMSS